MPAPIQPKVHSPGPLPRYTGGKGDRKLQAALNLLSSEIEQNRILKPGLNWTASPMGWDCSFPVGGSGSAWNHRWKVTNASADDTAKIKVAAQSLLYDSPDAQEEQTITALNTAVTVAAVGSVYVEIDVDLNGGVYEFNSAEIKTGKWATWPAAAAFSGSTQTYAYKEIAEIIEDTEANRTTWAGWDYVVVNGEYLIVQKVFTDLELLKVCYDDKAALLPYPR